MWLLINLCSYVIVKELCGVHAKMLKAYLQYQAVKSIILPPENGRRSHPHSVVLVIVIKNLTGAFASKRGGIISKLIHHF